MNVNKEYGPIVLRYGLVLVFLFFSISQLLNPVPWSGLIPEFITGMGISAVTMVIINAVAELILLALLASGLFTRIVGFLMGLHLLSIVWILGFTPIGARDFGLAMAAFSVFFNGPDKWCLDNKLMKKK